MTEGVVWLIGYLSLAGEAPRNGAGLAVLKAALPGVADAAAEVDAAVCCAFAS